MFMISRIMFDVAYKNKGHLTITPYEPKHHIHNFYYFRLGARKVGDEVVKLDQPLRLAPRGFERIWSMERFKLGDRVVGLFGGVSGLVDRGLQLVHSPSIDPGFDGVLALGLRNNLDERVEIAAGERIGKILFFDCADTFINVEDFVTNIIKEGDLAARQRASEAMLRMVSQFMEEQKADPGDG